MEYHPADVERLQASTPREMEYRCEEEQSGNEEALTWYDVKKAISLVDRLLQNSLSENRTRSKICRYDTYPLPQWFIPSGRVSIAR